MDSERRPGRLLRRELTRALAALALGLALAAPAAAARGSARIVNGSLSFRDPTVGALLRRPRPRSAQCLVLGHARSAAARS